jgi:glutathione S-transferase
MYKLYIANKNYSSWSLRPWVLMRELKIPFAEQNVRFESSNNWQRFRSFSPSGRVPCLVDGEVTVWDSLAIAEYLAERHPQVWPKESRTRAWARSATAEMHSGFGTLRDKCSMTCGVRIRLHELSPALLKDIARFDELWNEGLNQFGGPFLAGQAFTAVDAFYAPVVFRAQTYGLKLSEIAAAYAARMLALPSMREWYEAALAETFRDVDHEKEILANGVVIEDLRSKS